MDCWIDGWIDERIKMPISKSSKGEIFCRYLCPWVLLIVDEHRVFNEDLDGPLWFLWCIDVELFFDLSFVALSGALQPAYNPAYNTPPGQP